MIDVQNLNIKFRNEKNWLEVVHDVSFRVDQGMVLGIVGESGAGKSVISLAIMGLLNKGSSKVSGRIIFNSTDLTTLTSKELQLYRGNKLAMIFQEPMTSLNPVLTCGYQVAETIRKHQPNVYQQKDLSKVVIDLFKEVELPRPAELFNSYPHELSGGQKQRVMIAMALSCNPELLIADEPTTALDATVQKVILDLLLAVSKRRNMGMVLISHDLGVIREVADEVMVMRDGSVVEKGDANMVLDNPSTPYTRGLLSSRPVLGKKYKRLPELSDFLEDPNTTRKIFLPVTREESEARLIKLQSVPPLIQIKDLKMEFPSDKGFLRRSGEAVKAVDGVTFDIYPGEIVGLVGESGCGKTTLGRCILRLSEPTAGEILYNNRDLLKLGNQEMRIQRRKMQIMFQDPYSSLNPVMTVGEAIIEPMRYHQILSSDRERKEFAVNLLEKVNMSSDHFYRYPHEFSGGQRQRIGIARALALQPEFIVCDETVSALDVSVQAQVLNLLTELQQEFNLTYLFITHDLSVVYHLSDKIIVMNRGRIEETGTPAQLFNSPSAAYTKSLLAAVV